MPIETQERADVSETEFNPYQFFECGSRDAAKVRFSRLIQEGFAKYPGDKEKVYLYWGDTGELLRRVCHGDYSAVNADLVEMASITFGFNFDEGLGKLLEISQSDRAMIQSRMKKEGFFSMGPQDGLIEQYLFAYLAHHL